MRSGAAGALPERRRQRNKQKSKFHQLNPRKATTMIRCNVFATITFILYAVSCAQAGAPVIIEPGLDQQVPIYVQNGSPFKMVCRADGDQDVVWWHEGLKIDNQGGRNGDRLLILSEKRMGDNGPYVLSNLTFTPVRLEDKGRYECRLATSGSGTGYATTVEVLIELYEEDDVKVKDDTLVIGGDATLGCKIVGDMYQSSSFKWYRAEAPEKELTDKEKYVTDRENGTLTIKNAVEADAGLYLCRYFMQDGGVLEKTVSLNSAPFVRKFESKSKNLVQGDPLRIDCKVYSEPAPTITWLRDEADIDLSDPRVSLEEHDGLANATLRIKDMDFEDRAAYMCLATNEFGSGNSTIMVRVKDKLAALWPFLGICAEVVILCTIIFIYERRRAKKMEEEEMPEEAGHLTNSHDHKGKDDIRQRK